MTKAHELDRTKQTATPAGSHDDAVAPGRIARSAALVGPNGLMPSGLIQRKARDANGVEEGAGDAVARASSSSGAALPEGLMRKFESSLGSDLSGVRVHTGSESADAASAVGAKAYTLGQDIHFGAGHFDPSSSTGEHLLAHEVAHTVQQRGGVARMQLKPAVSSPGDAHEVEADRAADAMVLGRAFSVSGTSPGVHREIEKDKGASVAVSKNSIKVDLKGGAHKVIPLHRYVKLELGGEFDLEGSLENQEGEAGGAEGGGAKDNPEADRAEAEKQGSAKAKELIEKGEGLNKSDFSASVEWPEVELGTKKSGNASVTIKIKAFGQTIEVKPTLVEIEEGKIKDVAFVGVEVPFDLWHRTLWQNERRQLVVSTKFKVAGKLKPDWENITLEAVKRFGKVALDVAGDAAMTVLEAMGTCAGMTAGFVAMAATMVLAGYMDALETDNIDAAVAKGKKEIDNAVAAAMDAYGVRASTAGGDFAASAYTAAWNQVAEAFVKAKSDPKFAKFHFDLNDPQLRGEVARSLAPNSSVLEARARRAATASVAQGVAQQYYDQHYDDTMRSDGHARAMAETICARLGGDSRWSPHQSAAQKAAENEGKGARATSASKLGGVDPATAAKLEEQGRAARQAREDQAIRNQQDQDAQTSSVTRNSLPPAYGTSPAPQPTTDNPLAPLPQSPASGQ